MNFFWEGISGEVVYKPQIRNFRWMPSGNFFFLSPNRHTISNDANHGKMIVFSLDLMMFVQHI
jgi:hypothetical protein